MASQTYTHFEKSQLRSPLELFICILLSPYEGFGVEVYMGIMGPYKMCIPSYLKPNIMVY